MSLAVEGSIQERALEVLRQQGNPFRNYFARNPDDEVCSRYHVAELYAREREQLLGVVDLYRGDATTHSEVVPVLGNKGAGKTHLLHSIKHGEPSGRGEPAEHAGRQLLVTPGTYQKGTDFLEYLLYQIIDTLLGGGKQRGVRPIEFVGEELTRRLLRDALQSLSSSERLELFPAPALARWVRKLGLGSTQAEERTQWLVDALAHPGPGAAGVRKACADAGLDLGRAAELVCRHVERTEVHNTAGQLRRRIHQGLVRAALLGKEGDLAGFLTYGFAELDFQVRPSRQDLVLALLKVLMDVFLNLKVPVVVAFDQLEDLLLVRRTEDAHKVSESFFAGIVQVMHQVDGICLLIFAERGLWNRFVPSLDGYIQDRLNNPVHVPKFGTIKTLRLEAPSPQLVWQVVAARLRPALEELPEAAELSPIFPFTDEQVARIARTEPTLRDMLQQFRHLFDHVVTGSVTPAAYEPASERDSAGASARDVTASERETVGELERENLPAGVKSFTLVRSHAPTLSRSHALTLAETWKQEVQASRAKLEPEGALTGATRELQAGLGAFLQLCQEHGVKVGAWRLQHVAPDYTFGEHPTYGALSIAHWACKDGQPWRVGVGLFLGRGPGKPKDLQIKLSALEGEPPIVDQLILLRPADDTNLSGKSKALWDETERQGKQLRLEPVDLSEFAALYGFPRWLTAVTESLPEGQPLPNLAEFLQEQCEKLLEQLCLPRQEE